jgi:Rieske 2Fe-2S family protein
MTSPRSDILTQVIAACRPGHSLPRAAYLSPEVFAADMEILTRRWIFAGHISEVAAPGDWITAELGDESAIVVRGADGEVRALANVCRHRGSRICDAAGGHGSVLTCSYHAWTYHLDGRLRGAREMPEGFDPSAHGLKPLPITIIGGLIFVAFAPDPPSLDLAAPALEAMARLYDWPGARIALRRSYEVAANWKLVLENYHECYHCGPAHPEFSRLHALAAPGARVVSDKADALTGLADVEAWGPASDGAEVVRVMRSRLLPGFETGSEDGARLAPPMGEGGTRATGLCVFAELGFLSAFLAYPDHGVIYRFAPLSPLLTRMEMIWLVAGAAREGDDYDPARLSWLWDVTSLADKRIIERNQAGVKSRAYAPGPFSLMETGARQYVERYVGELAALARTGSNQHVQPLQAPEEGKGAPDRRGGGVGEAQVREAREKAP